MPVPPPVRKTRPVQKIDPGTYTRNLAAASTGADVCALDPNGSPCRAIYIGGAGTITVEHPGDYGTTGTQQQVTWTVTAGTYLPVCIAKVVASGTATNIVFVW
jgi:hypothetical protein